MKKAVKAALLLVIILTVIYAIVVVYANTNLRSPKPLYAAFEYESETPLASWYTLEQLGIVNVIEYEENGWIHIEVDREKEPFPLQSELPIFLYQDKFYQVSPLWVTPGLPKSVRLLQIPIGGALGTGWIFTGIRFLNGRKK